MGLGLGTVGLRPTGRTRFGSSRAPRSGCQCSDPVTRTQWSQGHSPTSKTGPRDSLCPNHPPRLGVSAESAVSVRITGARLLAVAVPSPGSGAAAQESGFQARSFKTPGSSMLEH